MSRFSKVVQNREDSAKVIYQTHPSPIYYAQGIDVIFCDCFIFFFDFPASMMQLFASVLSENALSSRTEFIYSFLQEILTCGDAVSSTVLQFMPVSMVSCVF